MPVRVGVIMFMAMAVSVIMHNFFWMYMYMRMRGSYCVFRPIVAFRMSVVMFVALAMSTVMLYLCWVLMDIFVLVTMMMTIVFIRAHSKTPFVGFLASIRLKSSEIGALGLEVPFYCLA